MQHLLTLLAPCLMGMGVGMGMPVGLARGLEMSLHPYKMEMLMLRDRKSYSKS